MRNVIAFLLCLVEATFSGLAFSIGNNQFKVWHTDCCIKRLEELVRFSNRLNLVLRHRKVKERWQKLKEGVGE